MKSECECVAFDVNAWNDSRSKWIRGKGCTHHIKQYVGFMINTIPDGDKHLHATYKTHLDFNAWIPPNTQADTENLEQKAFAINQFSVSSSL